MRRAHNPRGIRTQPARNLHLAGGVLIIFVHCSDCKVLMVPAEVPAELPDDGPILCLDCLEEKQSSQEG